MAHFMIVSDSPTQDYENFLTEGMAEMRKYKVRSLAIVALLEKGEQEDTLNGYFNMDLRDLQVAAASIQADITDKLVRANLRRYLEELEETEDEEP